MSAQAALVLGWPIPSFLLWSVIAAAGAATVLSFASCPSISRKKCPGVPTRHSTSCTSVPRSSCNRPPASLSSSGPRRTAPIRRKRTNWPWALALVLQLVAFAWFALPPRRLPVPAMARAASRSLSAAHAWPRDSGDTLHNGSAGVDTACRARQQASPGLAVRRGRIGGALHRPGGSSLHDDQPSGNRCPCLRGRSLGRHSAATVARALRPLSMAVPRSSWRSRANGPPWRSPDVMGSAFVQPEPILRPSPATLAINVRAQR